MPDIEEAEGLHQLPRAGYRGVQPGLGGALHLIRHGDQRPALTRDATAAETRSCSVQTDDVKRLEDTKKLGYEIVHPLTTEPWGVRRFFVRAPDGNVINIVSHPE